MLNPPIISEFDPLVAEEGSTDPLSLQPFYDRLADRMLPAVTVRMRKFRFITAICAGARVCEKEFADDEVAADEISPPWLVFEWFVVEALVREHSGEGPMGIPGGSKVATALREGRPLGHDTYLKTATVFGFTGIFRRLVNRLRVLSDTMTLDDWGYRVLAGWERDRQMDGFVSGAASTAGGRLRERLVSAVREGMVRGATSKRTKDFWTTVAGHFDPARVGKHERTAMYDLLRSGSAASHGHESELVLALEKRGSVVNPDQEAGYMRVLAKTASAELAAIIWAIDAFEALARPLTDAFLLIRVLATQSNGPVGPTEFAANTRAAQLATALRAGADRVLADKSLGAWEDTLVAWAMKFEQVKSPQQLFEAVLSHHSAAQRAKPPDGKRDWLEPTRNGVIVRHEYALAEMPGDSSYVHQYRLPTMSRFLRELGRVK